MSDPMAEVVALLQPSAPFSKMVEAAGAWRVQRPGSGQPFYSAVLEGACRFSADGHEPVVLEAGDFILIPSARDFMSSSLTPPPSGATTTPTEVRPGEFRLGRQDGPPEVRMLAGYCEFGSSDAALLVSLMPPLVIVRGERRLSDLFRLLNEETRQQRPAREMILSRLLEVLLIEALRRHEGAAASPGLLRGLGDARVAAALRGIHASPSRAWTVAELAREAALSRSAFFERFNRAVGLAPMEYLLGWRMALAKDMLRRKAAGVGEIARRVGYSSASTFTIAFTRHAGMPPGRYAREASAQQGESRELSL